MKERNSAGKPLSPEHRKKISRSTKETWDRQRAEAGMPPIPTTPPTKKECDHDYEHPIRKGRAHYECKKCGKDITLFLVFLHDALNKEKAV